MARRIAATHPPGKGQTWFDLAPPSWTLCHTVHWVFETTDYFESEYNEQQYWILTEKGNLVFLSGWEEYKTFKNGMMPVHKSDTQVVVMDPRRIEELDYDHPQRSGPGWHGDREVGQLIYQTPGEGLSVRLNQLASR